MNSLTEILYIVGLFALRLGVPLAITLAIAFFLRRLDARWEEEARLEQEAGKTKRKVVEQEKVIPPPLRSPLPEPLPAAFDRAGKPCWEIKDCDPIAVEQCPAHQNPNIPCWQARREEEGKIPLECYHCELFLLTVQPSELPQMSQELMH